jgi:ferredoxin-nitrite reductase
MPEACTWVAVADAGELKPERACVVRAGGVDLALVCTTQGVFAMDNACPHSGGPLGEGSVQGDTLTCPLHGWQFECASGRSLTERRPPQRMYAVKIEKDRVWVEVPEAAPVPAPAEPDASPVGDATDRDHGPSDGIHFRREGGGSRGGAVAPPGSMKLSPVEVWKQAKHGLDVWPDALRYARDRTPMSKLEEAELERLKWYGFFYRKNNDLNHYMCRIRVPGCEMTAEQARTIAYVAYESGYSIVDVTTRGNVQIQGLTVDKLPAVLSALERAGLTSRQSGHDNVRNITSHPWSGLDPAELIDTRELARQIQAMIVGNREFSDLPRKVNVALCGRSDPAAHAWTQDLCFVGARGPGGSVGFQLLLGGNQGQSPKMSWHIPVFVHPEQVLGTTAAILRAFRELGYRHNRHQVRLRYLIERIGPDGMLLEVEKRLGYELERFPQPVATPGQEEGFVGWFAQKQVDRWALGVCVPVGRLTAEELEGLALVARQLGDGTLRTTYDQNLVLPGIPGAARDEAAFAIARHGLTFEPDLATRHMVACTGKQFCNIAVTETKGYAYQLVEELRRRRVQLHGIHIHLSGCPSACAMTYTTDIGLKGVKIRRGMRVLDAFDLYLGGGFGSEVQMGMLFQKGVPFGELPDVVEKLVREFYLKRAAGQSFSQYYRAQLRGHHPEPLKVELPRWQCTRCRHLHVALDPPAFCPVCAAIRSKFEPAPEETAGTEGAPAPAVKTRSAGKRLLIVGGSIAGHTAAQTARALDPDARITLVTDEKHSFYNRLNLTRFLAEEVRREELFDYGPPWYEERQVEVLTGTRVIGLDPIHKAALVSEGRELAYDACILAHGGSASAPIFYREDLAGLHPLRTLEDVDAILAGARPGARVAVVGGGVLGLEAAYGVKKRGASVRVFEYLPRLMPRQLDEEAAALFMERVRGLGIEALVGVSVQELLGEEKAEGLTLADGRRFEADLVVVSTGIRPNVDWVKRSGVLCQRGVLVDDRMSTSAPDVFAAGDVAEWRGQVVGLWTNAVEQAKVAGANAVGRAAFFQGFLPVTILKCLGIHLISMGDIQEDGDGITSRVTRDAGAGTYRRVIFRQGIPVGGILLGTSSGMGELRKLIEGGRELEELRRQVVPDEVAAL